VTLRETLIPTKREVIDINRHCQMKCVFCYHRFTTWDAKQGCAKYWALSWDKVIAEINSALAKGNTSIDFTGGEPTIWQDTKAGKKFVDVIKYCVTKGLWPCVITNGYNNPDVYYELIAAGCKEFLFSIHHTNEKLDDISQVKGHWLKLSKLIKEIKNIEGVMWRGNACINSHNYKELKDISKWAYENGCKVLNFININPPYETDLPHLKVLQVSVAESAPHIKEAIEYCYEHNMKVVVRYYPMCALKDDVKPGFYESFICDHPQVMFDPFEWSYGQYYKTVSNYLRHGREGFQYKSNQQTNKCGLCGLRNVCGGANLGYVAAKGEEELKPYEEKSDNPYYFHQKRIGCDILIPAYRMRAEIMQELNELPYKTQPPYNLHIFNKEQSAAKNRNDLLRACQEEYVIFLDDDIVNLPDNWNYDMIEVLRNNPDILAVSARLMDKDNHPALNSANNFDLGKPIIEVNLIPTACMCFRRRDAEGIKFNERHLGSGWEDTNFLRELQVKHPNKKTIIYNKVKVTHLNEEKNNNPWFEWNKQVFMEDEEKRNAKYNTKP